jgi:tRNA threonylcarbamoyladenosine biosynthesis protein TsaB
LLVLAIDTSDARGSIALRKNGTLAEVIEHSGSEDYSSWLLKAVNSLLARTGTRFEDLAVLAVSTGPGSFTGLRVGLTSVKALAEVYGKPVVGVSRLEAMAMRAGDCDGYIASCYDARRGHVFGAVYHRQGSDWRVIESEIVVPPEKFLATVMANCKSETVKWISLDADLITGQATWKERERVGDVMLDCGPDLASSIAELGEERAKKAQFTDALLLDANYVRRSDAEMFWRDPVIHDK